MRSLPVQRKKRASTDGGPQVFRSPTAVVIWWVWLVFAAANLVDLAVQGRDHTSVVVAAVLLLATGVAYVAALRPRVLADDAGLTVQNPLRDYRIGWAGVTKVDLVEVLRVYCEWGQAGPGPAGPGQEGRRSKVVQAWAVHYSRRRQLRDQVRTQRASVRMGTRRSFGIASYGGIDFYAGRSSGTGGRGGRGGYASGPDSLPASAAGAEAEKIVRTLSEYATRARTETFGETGGQDAADPPMAAESRAHPRNPGWLEPLTITFNRWALAAIIVPALIVLAAWLA